MQKQYYVGYFKKTTFTAKFATQKAPKNHTTKKNCNIQFQNTINRKLLTKTKMCDSETIASKCSPQKERKLNRSAIQAQKTRGQIHMKEHVSLTVVIRL